LEATIPTTDSKPTKTAWRRREFCEGYPCGDSYARDLEKDGLIETLQVSPKMTLILTSPEEARKRAAERYAASGKPAEVKRRLARIKPERRAKRDQAADTGEAA
jgi:hypothetical protein